MVPARAQAGASLLLRVTAAGAGEPVTGARVSIESAALAALVDWAGVASMRAIPAGERVVRVERIGFQPLIFSAEFRAGAVHQHAVERVPAPVEVAGVTGKGRHSAARLPADGIVGRYRITFIAGVNSMLDNVLVIDGTPSAYNATWTPARGDARLTSSSVRVDGSRVTIAFPGRRGTMTMRLDFRDTRVTGEWWFDRGQRGRIRGDKVR